MCGACVRDTLECTRKHAHHTQGRAGDVVARTHNKAGVGIVRSDRPMTRRATRAPSRSQGIITYTHEYTIRQLAQHTHLGNHSDASRIRLVLLADRVRIRGRMHGPHGAQEQKRPQRSHLGERHDFMHPSRQVCYELTFTHSGCFVLCAKDYLFGCLYARCVAIQRTRSPKSPR